MNMEAIKKQIPRNATMPRRRMEGRVVLVTGGGSGIGFATATLMAREGAAAVVIAGRRRTEGELAAAECKACGAESLFIRTDVSLEEDIKALVDVAVSQFGRLDVAFNNAGMQEQRAPIYEHIAQTYDTVFAVNVRSIFLCLKYQIQAMIPTGGGQIIVNASVSGLRNSNPGLALYSASKAAVISLMRTSAMESAPHGVRINAIAPGRVVTDMMLASGIADPSAIAASLPLRRMGQPGEIAEAVVWLASDEASYVVGHVLAADGGFTAT